MPSAQESKENLKRVGLRLNAVMKATNMHVDFNLSPEGGMGMRMENGPFMLSWFPLGSSDIDFPTPTWHITLSWRESTENIGRITYCGYNGWRAFGVTTSEAEQSSDDEVGFRWVEVLIRRFMNPQS